MLKMIGGVVFTGGVVLWLGNRFGFFPTFPLAGYLTMLAGGALFGVGSKGQTGEDASQ